MAEDSKELGSPDASPGANRETIEVDEASDRLDVFLASRLSDSRSQIKKWIDQKLVLVDGTIARPKDALLPGQWITLLERPIHAVELEPIPMDLDILFEDDELIVLNKPAGLSMHPGAGPPVATLVHGLLHHFGPEWHRNAGGGAENRPGIVHRLDKGTTGVVVCAKTASSHRHLAQQFHDKTNRREYVALLRHVPKQVEVIVDTWLGRDPKERTRFLSTPMGSGDKGPPNGRGWRRAVSRFCVRETFQNKLSLCQVTLKTGRTHQIRVHANALGSYVLGDPLYGRREQLPGVFTAHGANSAASTAVAAALSALQRPLLHAQILGFQHPKAKEALEFRAEIPEDFANVLKCLAPFSDGVVKPGQ